MCSSDLKKKKKKKEEEHLATYLCISKSYYWKQQAPSALGLKARGFCLLRCFHVALAPSRSLGPLKHSANCYSDSAMIVHADGPKSKTPGDPEIPMVTNGHVP